MEESVICLEDSTEIIDLSDTVANVSPQHSRDDMFEEFFVREKKRKTRKRTKSNSVIPAAVIDLSNESDLSSGSIVPEQSTRKSLDMCCPICFEKLSNLQIKATTCGHVFCSGCIDTTVKQTKKCPKCRKKLTMKNLIPLYI